ncbi:MAG: tRNA pseudouridine(54/55) synthase Pus10 [Candidatus Bathyarchaeia archaeon]|jgi:tRNA pseudouridine synthase 10
MSILQEAQRMLEKYPLCDHCLGRQFALLGHGVENDERGKAIKLALTFEAHALALSESKQGLKILRVLATNGFSKIATEIISRMGECIETKDILEKCFLCEGKLEICNDLAEKALGLLVEYEYSSFLAGIELSLIFAEREDEFRAEFGVSHGESLRKEFARTVGRRIAERSGKDVDFKKPEIVVLVEPFSGLVRLQVNPLFIAGRYKKLVRSIPQSKWFCSECWGKGCIKCNWTGKMYPESVQEIVEKPLLEATSGASASFHASGREDIDARMLGNGRPFVIEIATPKKRFLDLKKAEDAVNVYGVNKVEVVGLRFANRDVVRKLKGGESKQKEYRMFIEFENKITTKDMHFLEKSLTNVMIEQKTPVRVLHRRADLTRERYIYDVDVKKLSPRKAEMRLRCQGGLYVKELVTGDEGRTVPSVSEILKNKAKPMELDVLNIVMDD